jgi:hypothetical protein
VTSERAHDFKFFVYIVESPSAADIYHGRSEGYLVSNAVRLDGIPSVTRTAINAEAFGASLRFGLPEAMKLHPDLTPILHLSAHGSTEGIQLSSGETLTWEDLKMLLIPINTSLGNMLVLCMSACDGYSACRMAKQEADGPHPYFAMVGSYAKPTWADTAVAYSAFYHRVSKGHTLSDALQGMKAASGDDSWILETAEESKRSFLEYLSAHNLSEARQELEAAASEGTLSPNAKALELG